MTKHPLTGLNKMLKCMPRTRKDCCIISWHGGREEMRSEKKAEIEALIAMIEVKNDYIDNLEKDRPDGIIDKIINLIKDKKNVSTS